MEPTKGKRLAATRPKIQALRSSYVAQTKQKTCHPPSQLISLNTLPTCAPAYATRLPFARASRILVYSPPCKGEVTFKSCAKVKESRWTR